MFTKTTIISMLLSIMFVDCAETAEWCTFNMLSETCVQLTPLSLARTEQPRLQRTCGVSWSFGTQHLEFCLKMEDIGYYSLTWNRSMPSLSHCQIFRRRCTRILLAKSAAVILSSDKCTPTNNPLSPIHHKRDNIDCITNIQLFIHLQWNLREHHSTSGGLLFYSLWIPFPARPPIYV